MGTPLRAKPHPRIGGGEYRLLEADSENQGRAFVVHFKRKGEDVVLSCLREFGWSPSAEEAMGKVEKWIAANPGRLPEKFRNGRFLPAEITMFVEVP